MSKLFRLPFLAAAALTVATAFVAPTESYALAPIGDCPTVEVSYDGGATWSECRNWGRVETSDSVTCYYSC
jgi:hypothetical protein